MALRATLIRLPACVKRREPPSPRGGRPSRKENLKTVKVIANCNLKGGVAKTTTTVNLAADLARFEQKRVLVIDADSQANTTGFFANSEFGIRNSGTLADLLRMPKSERTNFSVSFDLRRAIQPSSFEGVDLLPADSSLMDLDLSKVESEQVFTQVLAQGLPELAREYDYVLIDCPPAFNAASAAALLAADAVLIPIKIDAFALEGMGNLMQQIVNMRRINPRLLVLGLLPVMWYRSPAVGRAELALRDTGLRVFPHIRRSDKVDDMTFTQEPLCVCSPKSGACKDYKLLARLIAGTGDQRRRPSTIRNSEGGAVNG